MGMSREGFDLFNRYGRAHIWQRIRLGGWRHVRRYVFRDTFAKWICALSGGHEYTLQPDAVNEPAELSCGWCHARKPREEISDASR